MTERSPASLRWTASSEAPTGWTVYDRVATTRMELDGVAHGIDPIAVVASSGARSIAIRSGLPSPSTTVISNAPAYIARAFW